MKKLYYLALAVAVSVAALSCDQQGMKEEAQNNTVPVSMTFRASNGPISRTYLDGAYVKWHNDDAISVFDALTAGKDVEHNRQFDVAEIDGGGVASFTGTAAVSAVYYAAYPYNEDNYATSEGKVRTEISATQTASTAQSFGKGANPSVAILKDGMFTFYNIAGLLKFTLSHDNVTAITVTAKDGGAVGGEYLIAFNGDGSIDAVNSSLESNYTSVTVAPASGTLAADTYYIPVVPRTYTGGITATLTLADGTTKTIGTTDNVIVQRSKITGLGTFKTINGVNFPVVFPLGWDSENSKGFYSEDRAWVADWISDGYYTSGNASADATGHHGTIHCMSQPQALITWNWAEDIAATGVKHYIELVNNEANKVGSFGVKGVWTNDYFEFVIPVNNLPASTTLRLEMPLFLRSRTPIFWEVLYKDGELWKTTATSQTSGAYTRTATWVWGTGGPLASSTTDTKRSIDFTISNAIADDNLYIRVKCVDGTIGVKDDNTLIEMDAPFASKGVASNIMYPFNPGDRTGQEIRITKLEP